jgi:hypothetical protein
MSCELDGIFGGAAPVAKEEPKTAAGFASGSAFLRSLKRQRTDPAAGPRRAMTAQKLLAAIGELRDPMVARLLDTAALDRALREASALEPYLRTLCEGVGAEVPTLHDSSEGAVVAGQYDSSAGIVVAVTAQTPWGVHAVEAGPETHLHATAAVCRLLLFTGALATTREESYCSAHETSCAIPTIKAMAFILDKHIVACYEAHQKTTNS